MGVIYCLIGHQQAVLEKLHLVVSSKASVRSKLVTSVAISQAG